jgi:hypothetical protein
MTGLFEPGAPVAHAHRPAACLQFCQVAALRWSSLTMSQHSEPRGSGWVLERGSTGTYQAYNEAAFRHFLALEVKRAERSGRVVLLLLISYGEAEAEGTMPSTVAAGIFGALSGSVRDVDFIGWYRTGRVIGAVLIQSGEVLSSTAAGRVNARIGGYLRQCLPARFGARIHLRVVHMAALGEI